MQQNLAICCEEELDPNVSLLRWHLCATGSFTVLWKLGVSQRNGTWNGMVLKAFPQELDLGAGSRRGYLRWVTGLDVRVRNYVPLNTHGILSFSSGLDPVKPLLMRNHLERSTGFDLALSAAKRHKPETEIGIAVMTAERIEWTLVSKLQPRSSIVDAVMQVLNKCLKLSLS